MSGEEKDPSVPSLCHYVGKQVTQGKDAFGTEAPFSLAGLTVFFSMARLPLSQLANAYRKSHTRAVRSKLAEASFVPSTENATL